MRNDKFKELREELLESSRWAFTHPRVCWLPVTVDRSQRVSDVRLHAGSVLHPIRS